MFHDILDSIVFKEVYDTTDAFVDKELAEEFAEEQREERERRKERERIARENSDKELTEKAKALAIRRNKYWRSEVEECEDQRISTQRIRGEEGEKIFLTCICGKYPYLLKAMGQIRPYSEWADNKRKLKALPHSADCWMLYCERCGIRTEFFDNLTTLRTRWNSFVLKGQIHADKDKKRYLWTQNGGDDGIRNGIAKLSMPKERAAFLEYCYYYDAMYSDKIKDLLKPGMKFKNYKELCAYLNEHSEKHGSKGYIKHSRFWKRFFHYGRIRHEIIILEVYDDYLPWSQKYPSVPNKNRTFNSYFPRAIGETEEYRSKVERRRRAKISASDKAQKELEAAKMKIKERKELGDRIEYEIFEDDAWEESSEDLEYSENLEEDDVGEEEEEGPEEFGEEEGVTNEQGNEQGRQHQTHGRRSNTFA